MSEQVNQHGFHVLQLNLDHLNFRLLKAETIFENVTKGRIGNHLVLPNKKGVPLVRTTSKYTIPPHTFSSVHLEITEAIRQQKPSDLTDIHFNNALIEVYDSTYRKMKYHSDQSLDLKPNSWVGLFSCYEHPEELNDQTKRKLKIKHKDSLEEFEIILNHQSVVLFSLNTNAHYLHKIVLEQVTGQKPVEKENRWLGITFREADTFVQFKDGVALLENGKQLTLANENEAKEFYQLRGQENRGIDFVYPRLSYTLSIGDTLPPKKCNT